MESLYTLEKLMEWKSKEMEQFFVKEYAERKETTITCLLKFLKPKKQGSNCCCC